MSKKRDKRFVNAQLFARSEAPRRRSASASGHANAPPTADQRFALTAAFDDTPARDEYGRRTRAVGRESSSSSSSSSGSSSGGAGDRGTDESSSQSDSYASSELSVGSSATSSDAAAGAGGVIAVRRRRNLLLSL